MAARTESEWKKPSPEELTVTAGGFSGENIPDISGENIPGISGENIPDISGENIIDALELLAVLPDGAVEHFLAKLADAELAYNAERDLHEYLHRQDRNSSVDIIIDEPAPIRDIVEDCAGEDHNDSEDVGVAIDVPLFPFDKMMFEDSDLLVWDGPPLTEFLNSCNFDTDWGLENSSISASDNVNTPTISVLTADIIVIPDTAVTFASGDIIAIPDNPTGDITDSPTAPFDGNYTLAPTNDIFDTLTHVEPAFSGNDVMVPCNLNTQCAFQGDERLSQDFNTKNTMNFTDAFMPASPTTATTKQQMNIGPWTEKEQRLFLEGLEKFGRGKWKEIADVVGTRTRSQVASHGRTNSNSQDSKRRRICERCESSMDTCR